MRGELRQLHVVPLPLPLLLFCAHFTIPPPLLPPLHCCSPAGQYAKLVSGTYVCTACKANYYRSGDASPNNNMCLPVPAGYREMTNADRSTAQISGHAVIAPQSQVVPCSVGTFSSWSGNAASPDTSNATRTPATATLCTPCTLNLYAPRTGMSQCVACKGGTAPTKSSSGLLGPNQCTPCTTTFGINTFRSALTSRFAGEGRAPLLCSPRRLASIDVPQDDVPLSNNLCPLPPLILFLTYAAPPALSVWLAPRPPHLATRLALSANQAL